MVAEADVDDVASRLWLARDVAKVIAALPPGEWTHHIERLTTYLKLPPGMLHLDVIDAAESWDRDRARQAARHIRMIATREMPPAHQQPQSASVTRGRGVPHRTAPAVAAEGTATHPTAAPTRGPSIRR